MKMYYCTFTYANEKHEAYIYAADHIAAKQAIIEHKADGVSDFHATEIDKPAVGRIFMCRTVL